MLSNDSCYAVTDSLKLLLYEHLSLLGLAPSIPLLFHDHLQLLSLVLKHVRPGAAGGPVNRPLPIPVLLHPLLVTPPVLRFYLLEVQRKLLNRHLTDAHYLVFDVPLELALELRYGLLGPLKVVYESDLRVNLLAVFDGLLRRLQCFIDLAERRLLLKLNRGLIE